MHIGGVVDQVAQPDNILLLQNLGLNAAVRKISAEQLELLKQIALNAIAYLIPNLDVELPFHNLAGKSKGAHFHDFLLQQFLLLHIGRRSECGRQLRQQRRNIYRAGYGKKLKRVLCAGQAYRKLLGNQPLFVFAEQFCADRVDLQIRQSQIVTGIEEVPPNIFHIHKLIGGDLGQFFLVLVLRFFVFGRQLQKNQRPTAQQRTDADHNNRQKQFIDLAFFAIKIGPAFQQSRVL